MNLSSLRTLGNSGLLVSPFALGAMTFGNKGWGSPDDVSEEILRAYVEGGGNFIDTADVYSGGRSEELVGQFVEEQKLRDKVVVASKFSFSGGNGRKNMHRAIEGSLRRLRTDYIDLYWMHVWDGVTPCEEMLESMGNLVRAGKIRYFGLSDMPAWYATKMATLARVHGVPGPIAMQLEYSLVERSMEREHVPAARELAMGITPWSPLGFGFLSGKYSREGTENLGRLHKAGNVFKKFTDRNWAILDSLRQVSEDLAKPMAEVALAWAAAQPGVSSLIIGASNMEQFRQNLGALSLELPTGQMEVLSKASELEPSSPYGIFTDAIRKSIFGGIDVKGLV